MGSCAPIQANRTGVIPSGNPNNSSTKNKKESNQQISPVKKSNGPPEELIIKQNKISLIENNENIIELQDPVLKTTAVPLTSKFDLIKAKTNKVIINALYLYFT